MTFAREKPLMRRLAAVSPVLIALTVMGTLASTPGTAAASTPSATVLHPGDLLVATSVYQNDSNIVAGTTQLPPGCGSAAAPCGTAVVDGTYPYVFNNATVDASFGVTSPITLDELTTSGAQVGSIVVPNSTQPGVSSTTDQMVTSFSSKSELALNLSTDGKYVTFMGYEAPVGAIDARTPTPPGTSTRHRSTPAPSTARWPSSARTASPVSPRPTPTAATTGARPS